jgi:membrane peptidoglycan carboxypeptidase
VHGEVRGVGEGYYAWFGADREAADKLLRGATSVRADDPKLAEKGQAYRRLLAMLIGQRRPHYFFLENREALRTVVESYLRVMPPDVISPALRDAALRERFEFADEETRKPMAEVTDRKGADVIRVHLLDTLGVSDLYTLDRLDLTANSTLDADAQVAVSDALRALNDPKVAAQAGLIAPLLLDQGDPAKVRYSFTLFERVNGANVLRVQTDTVDGPFSLNDGMKLELGSTAKLRTLVTYLEVVAELHDRYEDRAPADLARVKVDPRDDLTAFVVQRLREHPGEPLLETLEAAMDRPYSGSPKEAFVTGGGVHRFHNFTGKEDDQVYTVRDAFAHSVNLSFIRIMRDLVDHFEAQGQGGDVDLDEPATRKTYLERFADFEGRVYLGRFLQRYKGLAPDVALEKLVEGVRPTPEKLTVVFRSVRPEGTLDELTAFLRAHLPKDVTDKKIAELYERHAPGNFDLQDRGYLAGVHPLELWLVGWLQQHPQGTRAEAEKASAAERLDVYRWLMGTSRKVQQDRRIRVLVEMDAFAEIHQRWQRLGYPFDHLVPSLGTALGSSGDRPTALAELVGILLADGVRYPTQRVDRLHFAENTPYDTTVRLPGGEGERVLPPEVCQVVREAMRGVVTDGTASRLEGAFERWGLQVGGKTGTGDNRRERFDRHGRLVGEEVRNRTGTLVFYIGDRWFGAVTAHVPGQDAAAYHFTSALSAQVLKYLAPSLKSVFEKAPLATTAAPHRPL